MQIDPSKLQLIGPLAYQGKTGCESVICRRGDLFRDEKDEACLGWHCSYCDEPCSSQGHNCDASKTILGEAKKVLGETKEPTDG